MNVMGPERIETMWCWIRLNGWIDDQTEHTLAFADIGVMEFVHTFNENEIGERNI